MSVEERLELKDEISRLRRKLGEPGLIATIPGAGYRLEAPS